MNTQGNTLRDIYSLCLSLEAPDLVVDMETLFGKMMYPQDISVIIIGQDAYKDKSKCTSMAFSYPQGMMASDSVLYIIQGALKGKGLIDPELTSTGYLGAWRDQGVLLINTNTVGIAKFLEAILDLVSPVGILLGRDAEMFQRCFKKSFFWNHPSRKSTINNNPEDPRHWNHVDVFWKVNEYLLHHQKKMPIIWSKILGEHSLWIFTDGGCSLQSGIGAAGFVVYNSRQMYLGHWARYSRKYNTNNVAEISAIIEALKVFKDYPYRIHLVTDSQVCILGLNNYRTWEIKGELHKKKNVALVKEAVLLYEQMKNIVLIHTRGHLVETEDMDPRQRFLIHGNNSVDELVSCKDLSVVAKRLDRIF